MNTTPTANRISLQLPLNGMNAFLMIWFGQFISLVGTGMTRFALLTWVFTKTGRATDVALLGFFSLILYVVCSPFAGAVVDRLDRRTVLAVTDIGAGVMTLIIMGLFTLGDLHLWQLYIAVALAGGFEAFQHPAYHSATSILVPRRHYGRINGLRVLAGDGSKILGPMLGGVVLVTLGIYAVFIIDVLTFLIGVSVLLMVRIPKPTPTIDGEDATGTFWQDVTFGFRYIFRRPGLLGLMLLFTVINFIATLTYLGVLPAMILSRTGGDEFALASVQALMGGAGVLGALTLSVWGGPKGKQIHLLLLSMAFSFLFGDFLMGTGRDLSVWFLAAMMTSFAIPLLVGADRTIWQRKVSPVAFGRVIAVRALFTEAVLPLGFLITGPLADRLFEPALRQGLMHLPASELVLAVWTTPLADGAWVALFGGLVGTGPGAGMGLMFVCTALMGMTVSLGAYLIPAIRNVEDDLPDHTYDADTPAAIVENSEATVIGSIHI